MNRNEAVGIMTQETNPNPRAATRIPAGSLDEKIS